DYGRIAGRTYVAWCLAAVSLPVLAGYLFDRTGGYGTPVLIAAGANLAGMALALTMPTAGSGRMEPLAVPFDRKRVVPGASTEALWHLRQSIHGRVIWILPARRFQQGAVRKLAAQFGDKTVTIPAVRRDGVHPSDYRRLADLTR